VPFLPEGKVSLDEEVQLIIGKPPEVRSKAGERVGSVQGASATAMRNCIELGYEMTGIITSLSPDRSSGEIVVMGRSS